MAINLVAGTAVTNVPYTGENNGFKYTVNVQKNGTEIQSINGQIQKDDAQIGNFNMYSKNPVNISFPESLTLAEKQAIVVDIDDIIDQLKA